MKYTMALHFDKKLMDRISEEETAKNTVSP